MQNKISKHVLAGMYAASVLVTPDLAVAQDALDSGDTAWMLTSTALVLFMTIPGLSLFYAGMVRVKNVLSVMMQCFTICCLMTVLWVLYVYSLAFSDGSAYVGDLGKAFMSGIGVDTLSGTIPETVFFMFQLTFAVITPALIVGAFAERMKFSAMLWFMAIWVSVVYAPIAHWVWSEGGWLYKLGVLDFAGGIVVHINAGIAALVAAIVLGKRHGYPRAPMRPNNLVLTMVGAGMLWVGWFGFNAGSGLAANGVAGMAMVVTQISTAAAALTWMFLEWKSHGKPSALGLVSGAVAGLGAITPASGYVGPMGAFVIGITSGLACYVAVVKVKSVLGYDDSLDVFGVHGVGGTIGVLLAGVFVADRFGGAGLAEGVSMASQVGTQVIGIAATIVYCGVVSFIILKVLDNVIGLRVSEQDEQEGLDIVCHDEQGYNL